MVLRLGACLFVLAATACGNSKAIEETVQCGPVDASLACPADTPTYVQVAPIVLKTCVPCHHGHDPDGPWPLLDYDDVASWASEIKDELVTCAMPPADGGVPITNEERTAIVQWVLCKAPP